MKTLELGLNRRLLIVEMTGELDTLDVFSWNNQPVKKICKGSDLTDEDIILFVHYWYNEMTDELFCRDYKSKIIDNHDADSLRHSFISAVEAEGYHWGENPEGDQPHNTGLLNLYPTGHALMDVSLDEAKKWQEAESRTFYPEKCIICEIL